MEIFEQVFDILNRLGINDYFAAFIPIVLGMFILGRFLPGINSNDEEDHDDDF